MIISPSSSTLQIKQRISGQLAVRTKSSAIAGVKPTILVVTYLEGHPKSIIFISPPGNDSFREDLYFCGIYFLFFLRVISELRRPIGAKFCTMLGAAFNFIIPVQNFGGTSQKKFLGAKNMQNLAQFRSNSEFDGEYLQNE